MSNWVRTLGIVMLVGLMAVLSPETAGAQRPCNELTPERPCRFAGYVVGEIVGTVMDRTTSQPGVGITVLANDITVQTDERGVFVIPELPVGTYVVTLKLPEGYTQVWEPKPIVITQRKRYYISLDYFSGPPSGDPLLKYPPVFRTSLPLPPPVVLYPEPVGHHAPPPLHSPYPVYPVEPPPPPPPPVVVHPPPPVIVHPPPKILLLPETGASLSFRPLTRLTTMPLERAVPSLCARVYTPAAQESLSGIAEQFYGTPLAYRLIIEATEIAAEDDPTFAPVLDPAQLEPDGKLCLPGLREMAHAGE